MIRLLQKDGKIVGAKQWVPSYPGAAGEGDWIDVEIHSLDEPPTPPQRTLAEELSIVFDVYNQSGFKSYQHRGEVLASKAKEVLLGDSRFDGLHKIIMKNWAQTSSRDIAKKILEYLREEQK